MTASPEEITSRLKLEHEIYADLARTLTSTLDLSEVLQIIMRKVGELIAPRNWSLLLMEPDGEHLRFELVTGEGDDVLTGLRLNVGEGIAGWVARNGEAILIEDVQKDPRFCARFDQLSCFETRSIICVPLKSRGRVLGVVELINRLEQASFTERDMHSLQTIAEYAAIAIANADLYRKAQWLSITDDHTSLFNVRYLYDALDGVLRSADDEGSEVCMVFFDLDRFKRVVDSYGHQLGSKVLREVGFLLRKLVRPEDIPVRYGGDEFLILMPHTTKEEALLFAGRIRERIKSNVFLTEEGININVTASFGVACYPRDARDKTELLKLADSAMYKIKETTRDSIGSA
ncbi:MAG: sensor domain-containing diguanylate cyclase [Syntrophobacter sp.]